MNWNSKHTRLAGTVLSSILAVFFVIGGAANMLASDTTRADYVRWGYPAWFNYVTAVLELTAAALIALPRTRVTGLVLAGMIMVSAKATLLLNEEYAHAIAPLGALLTAGACLKMIFSRAS